MSVIPGNKLQTKLQRTSFETGAPGSGTIHSASGIITDVYDSEKIATGISIPIEIKNRIDNNPGLVFAKIRLLNGKDYVLPFKQPEDEIFSVYGNHMLLEGRAAKVEYGGVNIETGHIVLQRTFRIATLDLREAGSILDVGAII